MAYKYGEPKKYENTEITYTQLWSKWVSDSACYTGFSGFPWELMKLCNQSFMLKEPILTSEVMKCHNRITGKNHMKKYKKSSQQEQGWPKSYNVTSNRSPLSPSSASEILSLSHGGLNIHDIYGVITSQFKIHGAILLSSQQEAMLMH